jgi:hypothetical protein
MSHMSLRRVSRGKEARWAQEPTSIVIDEDAVRLAGRVAQAARVRGMAKATAV